MAEGKERKKPARYKLGEELDERLSDLSEGYRGAPPTRLVREAVEEFIQRCLDNEPAVKRRYEAARRKRLGDQPQSFTVIKDSEN